MRKIFRYQKPISLIVLVSLYWLCMPQLPAQGAMVATEDTLDRGSQTDFDRVRIKEFLNRNDVIVQLKSYGISAEEAQARVDSLTDQEIALIAGKLDELPAGGFFTINGEAIGAAVYPYLLLAALIIAIIIAIIAYALDEGPNKPTYREF
ncbi:MAG: PA2779 family protein [Desulfobacterales bacterium]|nr:MAG: PA2779 family protein [Desulfobacterales bacterium]